MNAQRRKTIDADDIRIAARRWPYRYQTKDGRTFIGLPISQVSAAVRDSGWRNVPRIDASDIKKLGLKIVEARYVGGVRPKRFCDVVWCWDNYQQSQAGPELLSQAISLSKLQPG